MLTCAGTIGNQALLTLFQYCWRFFICLGFLGGFLAGGFWVFWGIFLLFFFLMWDGKQLKKCSINANLKREFHDFLKGEEGYLNIF